MCFDLCVKSIEDTIITMKHMDYRHIVTGYVDDTTIKEIISDLKKINKKLEKFEGKHKNNNSLCPLCVTHNHHDHVKTEWRRAKMGEKE